MLIDIAFLIVLIFGIYKGYSKGFIVAVFSFAALFIGLAAALKLSSAVAERLHTSTNLNGYWLPAVSFMLVFALFVFVIRAGAVVIKKLAGIVLMGPLDTLGGVVLYVLIYLMIYSVVLFYAAHLHIISPKARSASVTYSFVAPFAPKVIDAFGLIIPYFKNMFGELSDFFGDVSRRG